jgi:ferredoxin
MKIIHEKIKCIGCGACASICPDHFKIAEDGKAHLNNSELTNEESEEYTLEVEELGCAKDAADSCPVQCIHIK